MELPVSRRIPLFVGPQATCDTCGREIRDRATLEAWGRHCSARCYHARGLPRVFRKAA